MAVSSSPLTRPLLLVTAFPGDGHIGPILAVVSQLVVRGYEVVFLSTKAYRDKIIEAGAEFVPMKETEELIMPTQAPQFHALPIGPERSSLQLIHMFYDGLPNRVAIFTATLEMLRVREPERQVIILEDITNMCTQPFRHGRPLPQGYEEFPKTIGISPTPLIMSSVETGPGMFGLPPDSSESGRLRNAALIQLLREGPLKPLYKAWAKALVASGCTKQSDENPLNAFFTSHDATFVLCSPSLDYPMLDMPETIRFAGCLPRRAISASFQFPEWWSEITANASKGSNAKNVIFVSQGTVNTNWDQLVKPTLEALAGRDDCIVVIALGARGAQLPKDMSVPFNARVIDYLPYDAILEYSDVFISNGGYGAFGHAVMNGVPTVFAGETEDKLEVTMRGVWAGFAYSLKTQTPSVEAVRNGVDAVLKNPIYKEKAVALKKENEAMDCFSRIHNMVIEFTD